MSQSRLMLNWVLPNQLAIGRLPQPGDSEVLKDADIDVVLSLCAEAEGSLPSDVRQKFQCQRFILPDSEYFVPLDVRQLAKAVGIIHHHLQHQHKVYVHCLAGIQRSPTVCIAYLCTHHQLDLWHAVDWIKQSHPRAMPTEEQLQVIRALIQEVATSQ